MSEAGDSDVDELTQRRAAVRAPLPTACVLTLHGRRRAADCVDISETGLSCLVNPLDVGSPELLVGLAVRVQFTLAAGTLEFSATIARAGACSGGKVMLGLCFQNLSPRDGDQIRKEVFTQLRAIRASGRL